MPEAARLPWFGPIPPLLIGALIGVSMFALHGVGAIVLTLVGVGIAMKWVYRWHGGAPAGWPRCAGKWRQFQQARNEPPSSGNHAFDDYRREMLRRLEQDHQDFQSFLDRLRRAKDKAEFDQFMADRDRRGPPQEPPANGGNGGNPPPHNPWPNA